MSLAVIPDVVRGQEIFSLGPEDTALDAARMMHERDISSVVILDAEGALLGIVTERDMSRKVVSEDRRPHDVPLADIMTRDVFTILPGDSPYYALKLMLDRRFHHLPIVHEDRVVGMVSLRDLRLTVGAALKPRKPTTLWSFLGLSRASG